MKKDEKERERSISLVYAGFKPINIKITLVMGHWTLYGSVMIRFENFPIAYDDNNFEADFSLMLLEPIESNSGITTNLIYLNGTTVSLSNIGTFESWLKAQVANAWNNL